ncbi:hypothetical protein [Bacillus sp. AFS075034]|uniref:XkdQ/YqbQ family protein n=1 Tax=Bacillus sp. AFS075034 TaxID=2034281 RepID=UPI000BF3BCD3|nr:hypothetical protein [Bacillus sp. AFS075034]PFW61554.1 hypothetical protein COL20_17075 [Bacillus sp. AFS075034]
MLEVIIGNMVVTDAVVPPIKLDDDYESGPVKVEIPLVYQKEFDDIEGKPVCIRDENKAWFEGFVRSSKNTKSRNFSVTAYDPLFNLVKSDDEFVFQNRTATQMMWSITNKYGIPIKEMVDIGTVFPLMYLDKNNAQSIYEMYIIILYESKKQTGKKYWMRYEPGGIRIFNWIPPNQVPVLGVGLTNSEVTISTEEIKNSVKVVNREKNIVAYQTDNESIQRFGLLTTVEEYSANTEAEAQNYANTKVRLSSLPDVSRQIEHVHGLEEQRFWSGDYVYIEDPTNTVLGGYYFKKVSYSLYKNHVVLSADVTKTASLPDKAYVPPEQNNENNEG